MSALIVQTAPREIIRFFVSEAPPIVMVFPGVPKLEDELP